MATKTRKFLLRNLTERTHWRLQHASAWLGESMHTFLINAIEDRIAAHKVPATALDMPGDTNNDH
jgi:hypothetical protein